MLTESRRHNLSAVGQSIVDDTAGHQFALSMDGTAATLAYTVHGDRLHLVHTEVPEALAATASAAGWSKRRLPKPAQTT
jgi:hypothetical protein